MKPFLRNTVFFIGWILSPLTMWNDSLVNIPLSYLLASFLVGLVKVDFLVLVLVSYWMTNILGLYLMYVAGRQVFKRVGEPAGREEVFKEILKLVITTLAYSIILILLVRTGILRPFRF